MKNLKNIENMNKDDFFEICKDLAEGRIAENELNVDGVMAYYRRALLEFKRRRFIEGTISGLIDGYQEFALQSLNSIFESYGNNDFEECELWLVSFFNENIPAIECFSFPSMSLDAISTWLDILLDMKVKTIMYDTASLSFFVEEIFSAYFSRLPKKWRSCAGSNEEGICHFLQSLFDGGIIMYDPSDSDMKLYDVIKVFLPVESRIMSR